MRSSVTKSVEGASSAAPETIAVDSDVGHFRIRGLVGEGGMGQVYLARDLTLGRLVALKLLRLPGSRALDRIIGEARTTARLNHPNIVEVYATGVHGHQPYLVLEFVDGESLRTRTRRESMSVDEVVRVARAIADALDHAHAAGIIHGDLKEGNVMIGRDGRPRVVDFGLAVDLTATNTSRGGTPTHMSPEQWLLEPIGDRSDIWSLGVLMYRCLEGHHPFGPGLDDDALRRAVVDLGCASIPLRREGLPGSLVDLIQRCLSREPTQRPSARDARDALDRVLDVGLNHVHNSKSCS